MTFLIAYGNYWEAWSIIVTRIPCTSIAWSSVGSSMLTAIWAAGISYFCSSTILVNYPANCRVIYYDRSSTFEISWSIGSSAVRVCYPVGILHIYVMWLQYNAGVNKPIKNVLKPRIAFLVSKIHLTLCTFWHSSLVENTYGLLIINIVPHVIIWWTIFLNWYDMETPFVSVDHTRAWWLFIEGPRVPIA